MKAASITTPSSIRQQALGFTLSLPVQATLYTSLCSLTIWTLFFSSYPPVHNSLHEVRHHTLMVGCH
ncbi:MAG: CbtB-domain containing protein [Aphanothece sp. CMT-3BRIN-NPC111]|jgi:hypothetical protein|nr:CbtB-domain containing protein [Aphanothece sp. CMT-3BRIN-NPC111]